MEEFLDKQAEPTHNDMEKRLKLHDEKITSYHQVCVFAAAKKLNSVTMN